MALMTTLQKDTSYVWPGLFQLIVGVGSGMFNSPNTAAMMGAVAPHRRGIASGARMLVQNTGAVLSIAFVMAIVTLGIPKSVLFSIFSGLGNRISASQLDPFLSNMHSRSGAWRPSRSSARSSRSHGPSTSQEVG